MILPPAHMLAPAFLHALHIPGLELESSKMLVAGLSLRRLDWVEWFVLENGDTAERLKADFEEGSHTFLVVNRPDFQGDDAAADVLADSDMTTLQHLVTALRVAKPGELLDPLGSMRYERIRSRNRRTPGHFGRQLFERQSVLPYALQKGDVTEIEAILGDLCHPDVANDRTIQLALRHFDSSYDHYLDVEERLLHAFTALEATFGEYKKSARPVAGVSLGRSASALWRNSVGNTFASFLDDKNQARGLRNAAAHGDFNDWTDTEINAMIERLREVLRVGLRHLLRLAARRANLTSELESVAPGLGTVPGKVAFQHVLGHAANASVGAVTLLEQLFLES